jgi:dsRNA-specific ribonuclease
MAWLPDDQWMMQKMFKQMFQADGGMGGMGSMGGMGGKGQWGKGGKSSTPKGSKPSNWLPDDVWLLQKLLKQGGKGGKSQWGTGGSKGAGGKSFGKGKAAQAKKVNDANKSWKTRLSEAYAQKNKAAPTKDLFQYISEKLSDEQYSCALTSSSFSDTYAAPDLQPTKKEAEEAAAKVALEAEYPEVFKKIPKGAKTAKVQVKLEKGQKRGTSSLTANTDSKHKLNIACSQLLGRPLTKEDIVFKVEEKSGKFFGKVTLSVFDGVAIAGKPVNARDKTKKDAEKSAAQEALKKHATEFKEAAAAAKERKAIKEGPKKLP